MFNPAKASENIKKEFVDYIATSFSFDDKNLQKQFVEELNKNISKGPLLEIQDVFKTGKSINELIDEGVLSPLFRELEAGKPNGKLYKRRIPIDRPLYKHQEVAIRNIVNGHNVVISTGTGSGKTNCFLIPVLNELLREQEAGTLDNGIRALFIYPMNALANDQMKNIRNILMYYPDITFGVYNGATEYKEEDAVGVYEAMFGNEPVQELRKKLPNEILSRDQMKETPPNILFTNYAMLEHLLLRPDDNVLFANADFKFVVLDEAHVYTGATGIETSLLLRRLKARISASGDTQFILTSATLGSDESSDDDIVTFGQNLCGVRFDKKDIIRSERELYIKKQETKHYDSQIYIELVDDENYVKDVLAKYNIPFNENAEEAELLYDFIITSDLYDNMRLNIGRITDLKDLSKLLNIDLETAIAFISICTRAQKSGKSLIDARYHFFIRGLEGCYVTIEDNPKLFLNRKKEYFKEDGSFQAVFEIAQCHRCGKYAYVGKIKDSKLIQSSKFDEEVDYFYPLDEQNNNFEDDESELKDSEIYYLCPKCGGIISANEINATPCEHDQNQYIKVVKAKNRSKGARCGNCYTGDYERFYLGNDAATSVLATSLYEELPEIDYVEEEPKAIVNSRFAKFAANRKKQKKKIGRQFLAFSDSRQEAAKFACYLSDSYKEFLRRRGICNIVSSNKEKLINQSYNVLDFVNLLTNCFCSNKTFADSNNDNSSQTVNSTKNAWVAMLNELHRCNSATSLTSLGFIQFEYLGFDDSAIQTFAEEFNSDFNTMKNLLNLLMIEIVESGAISPESQTDINDDDREYIYYTSAQKYIAKQRAIDEKGNVNSCIKGWMPLKRDNGKYVKTKRHYYVSKALNVDDDTANYFLDYFFDYLTEKEVNDYAMENCENKFVMPARNFRVRVAGDPNIHWYKCKKCGKITTVNIKGMCVANKCNGQLEEINPEDIRKENHFANLYSSNRMSPLFIKEHTAQLSKKESAEYQEEFIKKEINALSCSTTFEMGVDVGDLETVFLRDVPPSPSNYAQRAGRAGRSVDAAAFALTYAKLSSHDLSFFKEPEQMISGVIMPPLFKVDNEKIVRRHIYAVALSMFFARNNEMYNHNRANEFIDNKGYEVFIGWIKSHPEDLKQLLKKSIPDIDNLHERIGINDFSWIESFSGKDGVFTTLIDEYENNVKELKKIIAGKDHGAGLAAQRKLDLYTNNQLIDFLARGNILPRYGFPVDTVELHQNAKADKLDKLSLNRDLQMAIAEYAPSSEVVANNKIYTSRYIKKSMTGTGKQAWHTAYIAKCPNPACGAVNYSLLPITGEGIKCFACGETITKRTALEYEESIEPREGFIAEKDPKPVPMTHQEKNYRTEDYYIGDKERKIISTKKFKFNNIGLEIESTSNDSLLVRSSKAFYVCDVCGYAVAEDENLSKEKLACEQMRRKAKKVEFSKRHEEPKHFHICEYSELKRKTLHNTFKTDVAKISFECDTSNRNQMLSVMYALLNAMSSYLNIERKDIKACLSPKVIGGVMNYSIIIYDSVPGGAGHSRRLVTDDGMLLYKIVEKALRSMKSCNCDPSCYNCLRCYENQKIHDLLDRHLAIDFLEKFIGKVEIA